MESDIETVTGINTENINSEISVYPNPATTYVNIKSNNIIEYIAVYSVDGRFVAKYNVNAISGTLFGLEAGNYILKIHTLNGNTEKRLLVK